MVEMVHDCIVDHSGFNGCCTAMWKANGKPTTLKLFLDSLSPKTEKHIIERTQCGRCYGPVARQTNT
jgi:hypothetical protein